MESGVAVGEEQRGDPGALEKLIGSPACCRGHLDNP